MVAERLASGEIEFGIIRSDAVGTRLKAIPLGMLEFALFVRRKRGTNRDWKAVLATHPLVLLEGAGSFRRELHRCSEEAGIALRIELECSSFPSVAKALRKTNMAAILPTLAAEEFSQTDYEQFPLPWAKTLSRKLSLAWNPRIAKVRDLISSTSDPLAKALSW